MAETAVLLASGADRPGVMDDLSQFLLEFGGNISDSRSVNLHGQFALLLLVRAEKSAMNLIGTKLTRLEDVGIHARLIPADEFHHPQTDTFPHIFIASGKDQSGVLHRISHLLRSVKVNIDDLQTRVFADGSFEIRLSLAVPRETPITHLRDYLSYLCTELNIKGELKEA